MSHKNNLRVRASTKPERNLAMPPEVAEYLRVEKETLAQWRWQKVGPPWTKVGGAVRYRWDDVEAWLDTQAQGGSAA